MTDFKNRLKEQTQATEKLLNDIQKHKAQKEKKKRATKKKRGRPKKDAESDDVKIRALTESEIDEVVDRHTRILSKADRAKGHQRVACDKCSKIMIIGQDPFKILNGRLLCGTCS